MKKLLTILILIMLIISFFQITSMYALYKEQIQGEYNTLIGAWKIKINETDVTTGGQVENFIISGNQLVSQSSEYVQTGKIAPNGETYFDIIIDPSNTDVSIIYTMDVDKAGIHIADTDTDIDLTDVIKFVGFDSYFGQGEDGQTNKVENDTAIMEENKYTALIPIDKINAGYKNYIRLYFRWENVETNNEKDSEIGSIENAKISIPLQINLKQYTGEVIGNEP